MTSHFKKGEANISAKEQQSEIVYNPSQLSRIFGVSQPTINNWIKEGRFSKVERVGKNKYVKIPESSIWTANNGQQNTVKKIAEEYGLQNKKRRKNSTSKGNQVI